MTTLDQLLAAICRDPADDQLRLVAADWLEEQGDTDRAEFIRVQCELTQPSRCDWVEVTGTDCATHNASVKPYRVMVKCPACTRQVALRRRERELVEKWGAVWVADMLKTQ